MAKDPQYVDEFKRISLTNGAIRIELGVSAAPVEEGQQPVSETTGMLVMSVEGFVRSAATMEAFFKQLVDKGVIRQNPPASGNPS